MKAEAIQPEQPKQRDYFFDNAKFILIILVVFSHAITPLIGVSQLARTLYLLLFSFHMPLFLFASGYFAKKTVAKREMIKPIQKLFVPYLIVQIIYTFFYYDVYGRELDFSLLEPHWSLWFLLTLFSFYYLVHLFKFSPYFIIAALVIGVAIGYADITPVFSLARTAVFFPFFLAGYFLERRHLSFLSHPWMKPIATLVILITCVFLYMYAFDIPYELFYGSKSYKELGFDGISAGVYRLCAYVFTVIVSLAFLALVPAEKQSFSHYATQTLYVYLLHGFLFRYLRETSFYDGIDTVFEISLIAVGCIIYAFLLSTPVIKKITQPILEPFAYFKQNKHRST
ncbi:acyltransferase family protein [Bacillus piscicola]|uniref:acyltransferase family protein n=1 Tax=Bacillus piscicola TaxID=1632684 RepID=UPI001F08EE9B|nr:acyltransferase family protein [Bacillus piscicola]